MTQIFGYSIPPPPWLTISTFFAVWVILPEKAGFPQICEPEEAELC